MCMRVSLPLVLSLLLPINGAVASESLQVPVGAAKMDITPDYPTRLCGYASRRTESEGVAQRIWAKALAIGGDTGEGPAMLLSVESCGVPPSVVNAVCERLKPTGLKRERLVVSVTHTHTAPWLMEYAPLLFHEPLPDTERQHLERYQRELIGKLAEVADRALKNRTPARLYWTRGEVRFAANRRVLKEGRWAGFGEQADGPVDNRLPILVAKRPDGKPIAIWANYACHGTTLGGNFNKICGDWAGYAQEYIEAEVPGATALISIGCGADANPSPRGKIEYCQQNGRVFANEVKRLLQGNLKPVDPAVVCRLVYVDLPLDKLPSREYWEQTAGAGGHRGVHAKRFLDQMKRGEAVPSTVRCPVAAWMFGDDLAMVFLGGEVVVDFAIRLYSELDTDRLWVTAYANEIPCYIASKRVLAEGGYEADSSMLYYAQPTRLAPDAEDVLINAVHELVHEQFGARRGTE